MSSSIGSEGVVSRASRSRTVKPMTSSVFIAGVVEPSCNSAVHAKRPSAFNYMAIEEDAGQADGDIEDEGELPTLMKSKVTLARR